MEITKNQYSFSQIPLTNEIVTTFDGKKLCCCLAKQPQKADFILFLHGYSNHTGYYEDTMTWFFNQGYSVGIFDIRGHGESEGRRGYVDNFDTYSKDIVTVISRQLDVCRPISTTIVGHSSGGLMACYSLLAKNYHIKVDNIILCCPNIARSNQTKIGKIKMTASRLINIIYPYFYIKKPGFLPEKTKDKKSCNFFKMDTNYFNRRSISWLIACELAQKTVFLKLKNWPMNVSMLLITSELDTAVDNRASKKLYDQLNTTYKKHKHYPAKGHQILNEEGSEEVYEEIKTWLSDKKHNPILNKTTL